MTAAEFRSIRKQLGLWQGQMAEALGVDRTTVVRYEMEDLGAGARTIHGSAAILMRLLASGQLTLEQLEATRREPEGDAAVPM